jgi:REP element-mobilizing transposase RayT
MIMGKHRGSGSHIVAAMHPYTSPSNRKQWYHIICALYRNRALLKIPATARFCERAITEACSSPGWTVDAVAVSSSQIRLLVLAPAGLSRDSIICAIKKPASLAIRRSGAIPPGHRVWGDKAWCFAVRTESAVNSIREHLIGMSASGAAQRRPSTSVQWPSAAGP